MRSALGRRGGDGADGRGLGAAGPAGQDRPAGDAGRAVRGRRRRRHARRRARGEAAQRRRRRPQDRDHQGVVRRQARRRGQRDAQARRAGQGRHHGRPAVGRRRHRGQGLREDAAATSPSSTAASGAQATTLVNPAPNFFRFNTEGAQWMVGLGKAALAKGYKRMMVIAEDYAFPYSQVQGFMAEYCRLGGKVPEKAWVPLGGKDYSSVIAQDPEGRRRAARRARRRRRGELPEPVRGGGRRQADPRRLDHGQPGRPQLPRQAARLAGRHAVGRPGRRRLRRRRVEGLRRRLPEELSRCRPAASRARACSPTCTTRT